MLEKEIKDLKEDLEHYQLLYGLVRYRLSDYLNLIKNLNELLNEHMSQSEILLFLDSNNAYKLKEILDGLELDLNDY